MKEKNKFNKKNKDLNGYASKISIKNNPITIEH